MSDRMQKIMPDKILENIRKKISENMPYRLVEIPENIQDRMSEKKLPIKWVKTYEQKIIDKKPDRI